MGWKDAVHYREARNYTCGYCSHVVGSKECYINPELRWEIYICPSCQKATFFTEDDQTPAPLPGNEVTDLPTEVESLYKEARTAAGARAYTAAVLACRKLLMNIAVSKGAPEGKRFATYVEYLAEQGHISQDSKEWVDQIRETGNEATHEIQLMKKHDADDLIALTEVLLKIVYEFPAKVKHKQAEKTTDIRLEETDDIPF